MPIDREAKPLPDIRADLSKPQYLIDPQVQLAGDVFELRWDDGGIHYSFGFDTGDSMAHWMVPLAACRVDKIMILNINFTGTFEFFLHESNYGGEVTTTACADSNGWVGVWEEGAWNSGDNDCYSEPPLGEELWPTTGQGGWVLDIDEKTHGTWLEIDLDTLGFSDTISTPFFIDAAVTRTDTNSWGIGAWDRIEEPHHGFKYYHPSRDWTPSGHPGWHVRSFGWDVYALVEYLEDIPPFIQDLTVLYTTMSTQPRDVAARIWDVNPGGGSAGVEEVWLTWDSEGVRDSIAMTLIEDSLYSGTIPGFDAGTTVSYWVTATDVAGNSISSTIYSYDIYVIAPNLIHLNNWESSCEALDITLESLAPGFEYDCCVSPFSFHWSCYGYYEYYETVIEVSTGYPANCLGDFFDPNALENWLASGNKKYVLIGDDWVHSCLNPWVDSMVIDFNPGDFGYDYLAIDTYYPNINLHQGGTEDGVSRLLPVHDNPISASLVDFLADSLFLNYDPNYEIGAPNWLDGVEPLDGAVVSFWGLTGVLDSTLSPPEDAETLATAVHHEHSNGSKIAFFGFDLLGLNTMGIDANSLHGAGYHWVGIYPQGPLAQTLLWLDFLKTDDQPNQSRPLEYLLLKNYPNPFNPATIIEFSIPQSGFVTLTVYDLVGREVGIILNQRMDAGHHKVQWNASGIPSGIYIVRMRSGNFTQTRKVTVLR